jgi:hypothetical protein
MTTKIEVLIKAQKITVNSLLSMIKLPVSIKIQQEGNKLKTRMQKQNKLRGCSYVLWWRANNHPPQTVNFT